MSRISLFAALVLICTGARAEASLTELESKWLRAAAPVLAYAQQINLPVDVAIQPQAKAGDVPLAMGLAGGRCKLVMSMRGNPKAEAQLLGVAPELQASVIEAMAAHELAHCWRHMQGVWNALPAGFVEAGEEEAEDVSLLAASKAQREQRREEAYADLAALAWTQRAHPQKYAQVHAWLTGVRAEQSVPRNSHDTRIWVRLAHDSTYFGSAHAPFEDVRQVWERGLLSGE